MNKDLEEFVNNLLNEKNLPDNLPADVRDQMSRDLSERVEERIKAVIVSNLPEQYHEDLISLNSKGDNDQEVQQFIQGKIPNLDAVVAAELVRFRNTYLGI